MTALTLAMMLRQNWNCHGFIGYPGQPYIQAGDGGGGSAKNTRAFGRGCPCFVVGVGVNLKQKKQYSISRDIRLLYPRRKALAFRATARYAVSTILLRGSSDVFNSRAPRHNVDYDGVRLVARSMHSALPRFSGFVLSRGE